MKVRNSISKEYAIIFQGNFTGNDLKIAYIPVISANYPKVVKSYIENCWQDLLEKAHQKNNLLFNGSLCHLKAYSLKEGTLHLQLCLTDYKNYACTRSLEFSKKFPSQGSSFPLAVCIAILTSDNRILLEKRSGIDTNNGKYHVFGGFINPESDCNSEGIPEPFMAIQRELKEETGLDIALNELKLLGLVKDMVQPHFELCFSAKMTHTADDLMQAIRQNAKDGEIGELFAVEANAWQNPTKLGQLTPTGRACLNLLTGLDGKHFNKYFPN